MTFPPESPSAPASAEVATRMLPAEKRASFSLAALFALRMLGLARIKTVLNAKAAEAAK